MVTCIRAFYWLPVYFGIVKTRTSTLWVPYGARVGTVRTLADALRACEHPYAKRTEPARSYERLGAEPYSAVRTHTGPFRARMHVTIP